ncbi:response regulator [Candidatus Roizmanbacteria bacterium]|nr:response regulator [Candidatus Roizmanbacteria bacterium]
MTKKILVVEDDAALRKVLQDRFLNEGLTVLEAENGEVGLTVALREMPQLILLDLLMPKMDGMTMLKKLRESGNYGKTVRVIVLTNLDANDKIIQNVIQTQPTYYLIKSNVKLEEIIEKVKEVMSSIKE